MKPIQAAGIGTLLSALLLTGCGAFVSAQQHIAAARRDIRAGDWQAARIELNTVLDAKGRHPQAWLLLAEVSLDTADLKGAEKALRRALGAGAKGPELDELRVRVWLLSGQAAAVVAAITHHTINLRQPAEALALARAYIALGRADQAAEALRPLLTAPRAPAEAHLLMAELQASAGHARAALAELDAASREEPKAAEPAFIRGRILASLGQLAPAERALEFSLQRMPPGEPVVEHAKALIALTEVQLAQGKLEAASQSQATLAKLVHGAPETKFLEARIKLARGDQSGAINDLELIVANAPNFVQGRLLLGAELLNGGEFEEAQAQLTRVLQQAPGDIAARGLLATADLRLRQPNAVLTVLRPVLTAQNPEPQLLALAGVAIGQFDDANAVLSAFELSNGIHADNATVRLNFAQACLSAARPDQALDLLQKSSGDDPRRESLLLSALLGARGPRAAGKEVARLLASRPQTPTALGVAAAYYIGQRQLGRARALIEEALRRDPGNFPMMLSLARVELAGGKPAAAQRILQGMLAKQPGALVIRLTLADALVRGRDFAQARHLLEAARSSNPGAAVEFGLARVALAQGDLARANADLDRSIASQPGRPAVVEQAIMLLLAANQDDAALQRIHALRAQNPADPAALLLEGDAESALGRPAEALAAFTQAQKLRPSGDLAVKLYLQGLAAHEAQPQQPLTQWLAGHPTDWHIREVLAEYYLGTRKLGPAVRELEEVLRHAPDDVTALNNLAWAYGKTRDPRAQALAEKAYRLAPRSPAVSDTLGWVLAREGKINQALPLLADATKLDPAEPEIEYHYAYTLFESGRRADARRILSKLVAGSKSFASRSEAERLLGPAGGTRAVHNRQP